MLLQMSETPSSILKLYDRVTPCLCVCKGRLISRFISQNFSCWWSWCHDATLILKILRLYLNGLWRHSDGHTFEVILCATAAYPCRQKCIPVYRKLLKCDIFYKHNVSCVIHGLEFLCGFLGAICALPRCPWRNTHDISETQDCFSSNFTSFFFKYSLKDDCIDENFYVH